jgi:hypothetical protein
MRGGRTPQTHRDPKPCILNLRCQPRAVVGLLLHPALIKAKILISENLGSGLVGRWGNVHVRWNLKLSRWEAAVGKLRVQHEITRFLPGANVRINAVVPLAAAWETNWKRPAVSTSPDGPDGEDGEGDLISPTQSHSSRCWVLPRSFHLCCCVVASWAAGEGIHFPKRPSPQFSPEQKRNREGSGP